ncbi:MAG: (d)CMP kinase [Pirellulales bacterium]|nr:(d)CMP kinase [Pirellulales bacterium]
MIITIDGPAGAGKSTVARGLARKLGFQFLDTGAMYRAVALAGLRGNIDWGRPDDLARLATTLNIELAGDRIFIDGEDVSEAIRTQETTAVTRYSAANPDIRAYLVERQREMAAKADFVTEGRDQGTVAFPDAAFKFFVTASPEERARRRLLDLQRQGESASLKKVLEDQNRRDRQDSSRDVGPLLKADDAIEILTDGLTIDEVVERMASIVKAG